MSHRLQQLCEAHGVAPRDAMYAGLALEEMAVYAANNRKQDSYLDVLVRAYKGNIEIDFRSYEGRLPE